MSGLCNILKNQKPKQRIKNKYMEKFENVERQLDRKDIEAFEEQFGVDLPQDFVDFYLFNNGGNPPFYYVEGEENVFALDGFLSINMESSPSTS